MSNPFPYWFTKKRKKEKEKAKKGKGCIFQIKTFKLRSASLTHIWFLCPVDPSRLEHFHCPTLCSLTCWQITSLLTRIPYIVGLISSLCCHSKQFLRLDLVRLIRLKLFIIYSHFGGGLCYFYHKKRKKRRVQYCKVGYVFRLCPIRRELGPRSQFHCSHNDCFCIALFIYASFIRSTWSFNNLFIYFASNRLMIQSFEELLKINYVINY